MREVSTLINSILSGDTDVSALVGSKIYPMIADQDDEFPFIVFRVSDLGAIAKSKIHEYRIQIICVHESFDDTLELMEKVMTAMESAGPDHRFHFKGSQPANESDYLFNIKIDYQFKFKQTII